MTNEKVNRSEGIVTQQGLYLEIRVASGWFFLKQDLLLKVRVACSLFSLEQDLLLEARVAFRYISFDFHCYRNDFQELLCAYSFHMIWEDQLCYWKEVLHMRNKTLNFRRIKRTLDYAVLIWMLISDGDVDIETTQR